MRTLNSSALIFTVSILTSPALAGSQETQSEQQIASRIDFGPSIESSMTQVDYLTIDSRHDLYSRDFEIPGYNGVWFSEGADTTGKLGTIRYKGPGVGIGAEFGSRETILGGLGSDGVGDGSRLERTKSSSVFYLSPELEGFSLVGSFARDRREQLRVGPLLSSAEQWSAGLNYDNDINGFQYGGDVFVGKRTITNGLGFKEDTYDSSGIGMELGYGGFSLGGSYANTGQMRLNGSAARTNLLTSDGDVITVESGYSAGPYRLTLAYLDVESSQEIAAGGVGDFSSVQLTGIYELDHNMELNSSVFFAKFNDEAQTRSSSSNAWAAVVGIRMTF